MWKKRDSSPSPSPFLLLSLSLLLSFVLSLSSSLSLTQMLLPSHVLTAPKERREIETYTVLKRMWTFKKRRENVPNSLSLSFPHPPLPPSLLHILFLLFMSAYLHIRAHALLKEWCQCLNILLLSSPQQSPLVFEAIARTKAQALCVAALCGWGRKFSLKRNFWEWKIQ